MFYIYTLVMAGYCTVLSTDYTKRSAGSASYGVTEVLSVLPCYCGHHHLTLLTLTTGAGVTRGNINQSSSLTADTGSGRLAGVALFILD